MLYVIAEGREQFEDYCRRHSIDPDDAVYVITADVLKGKRLKKHQIVMAGQWFVRPDRRELETAANAAISKARR